MTANPALFSPGGQAIASLPGGSLEVLEWTASKTGKTPAAILGLGAGSALAYITGQIYLYNNPVTDITITDDTDGGDFGAFERTSAIAPELSANGTRVRGELKIAEMNNTHSDNYLAGHPLIPFAELHKRSPDFLTALVASRFKLDQGTNLIALPGNMEKPVDLYWGFCCSTAVGGHIDRLIDLQPRRYNVEYGDYNKTPPFVPYVDDWAEWYTRRSKLSPAIQDYCDEPDAFDEMGTLRKKYRNDEHLTTLIIEDPTFTYDFFQQQGVYVSEKFRDTLLLPENSVEYVKLDDSRCPPELRAQKYMVMRVVAFRDVIDVTRSDGFSDEHPYMRLPTPHEPLVFAFKDVDVDVPLFFDYRFPRTIATDAFAETALRAGLTGFQFLGYNNPDGTDKTFYKTISD